MPPNTSKMLKELGVDEWPEIAQKQLKEAEEDIKEAHEGINEADKDATKVEKLVKETDLIPFQPGGPQVKAVFGLVKKYKLSMNDVLSAYASGGWDGDPRHEAKAGNHKKVMSSLEADKWPEKARKLLQDADKQKHEAMDTMKDVDSDVKTLTKLVNDTAPLVTERDPNAIKVVALAKRYKVAARDVYKAYDKAGWDVKA